MTAAGRSRQNVTRIEATGDEAVVAAARPEAAAAGMAMLEDGGNAVDAAVAVGWAAAVIEPMDTSIGGTGLMVVHDGAAGESWSVEFPPRAPLAARPGIYDVLDSRDATRLLGVSVVRDDANSEGWLAPGVPGTVAGLCLAQERFGRLPREQVMEPAIGLAEEGLEADAYYVLEALANLEYLRRDREAARTYLVDGLPPVPAFLGRATLAVPPVVRQPDLAGTLRAVARDGPAAFYTGEIADAIATAFSEQGGLLTREDLARYRATVERPLSRRYRDVEVLVPRCPGGGWTELQLLGLLERFDLAGLGHNSPEALHAFIEASRHAFADRYHYFGDPDEVAVPLDGILSDSYADEIAGQIAPDRPGLRFEPEDGHPWEAYAFEAVHDAWRHDPGAPPQHASAAAAGAGGSTAGGGGTTHFCVVDSRGMTVSCTHSAANAFGSKVMPKGTGVLLDSAMVWFNAQAGAANSIAPGRRPLVNMGPLVALREGTPLLALGAPGGRRLTSALVQVLSNVVDHGMSIGDAIGAPRIDASGLTVLASTRIPATARERLEDIGHPMLDVDEEHEPFSYEFARPVGAMVGDSGQRRGSADPFTIGVALAR
jgi:gamma-glutamyltranspeptidase / glutathione hydrolase